MLIVFVSNYQLPKRDNFQPEAAESRLHVYRMPMGPTNLLLPWKPSQVFRVISGNQQPRLQGDLFQTHGEVAAVWGNDSGGMTVRNKLYFSGWRVCLRG